MSGGVEVVIDEVKVCVITKKNACVQFAFSGEFAGMLECLLGHITAPSI